MTSLLQRVEAALPRHAEALFDGQAADGSLPGDNHGGPLCTGLYLLVAAWLGELSDQEARAATEWLRAQQRPDGAFCSTPVAEHPSDDATWCVVAGLRAAGIDGAGSAVDRAEKWLAGRPPGPFYRPLLALRDPSLAQPMPIEWAAVPGLRHLVWARFHPWIVFAMLTSGVLGEILRGRPPRPAVQHAALARIRALQNPGGSWVGAALFTLLGVVALRLLGAGVKDERVRDALAAMGRWKHPTGSGLEILPFTADTWNTARVLHTALLAGTSATDPRARTAASWLLDAQVLRDGPRDWQANRRGAPHHGGWAYESTDEHSPDCDTSAAVLAALAPFARQTGDARARSAVDLGTEWLLGMQNPDGGFPSFRQGLGTKPPGPIFLRPVDLPAGWAGRLRMACRPPPELLDPSTAGLTGRALAALAAAGVAPGVLRRGAAFLVGDQWDDRWFGRWDCNYQAGTAYALAGFGAAGSPHGDAVRRGVAFLERVQNRDGGWGEDIVSYRDPRAGRAPSRPDLTGTVLTGLCAVGRADTAVVRHGIEYLLDALERPDAPGPVPLYVLEPPDEFYSNPVAARCAPVEALATFRRRVG